jgi:hypothetical protein
MNSIYFTDSAGNSNSIRKIDLAKTLLSFSEFDFTFFWEQSIEAGKVAKRSGQLPKVTTGNAKAAMIKCHPFVTCAQNSEYNDIVLDCIIHFICRSERISEEELWTRCISSKIPYEKAIFKRICEYKTFRAVNQWEAVSGLQEYAKHKIEFIYGVSPLTEELAVRRREYYDLAFSVAANECAVPAEALPSVKRFNPCLMPGAVFTVNTSVTKNIYKRISDKLTNAPDYSSMGKLRSELLQDKFAAESFRFINDMPAPLEPELNLFISAMNGLPDEVYVATGLKGMLDLEFDKMAENGVHLKKCESCGRYFIINADEFDMKFCDRVTGNGKSCRENFEELRQSIAAVKKSAGIQNNIPVIDDTETENTADSSEYVVNKEEFFPELGQKVVIKYSAPVREFPPSEVPDELEKRGQKIYNTLYKRVGKAMTEQEFREWSQYFSNMKRNIKIGEGSAEQLSSFLDYSEKLADEIKVAVRDKKPMRRDPVERLARFAQSTDNMHNIGNLEFPSYDEAEAAEGRVIKPFNPPKLDNRENHKTQNAEIQNNNPFPDGSPFDEPSEPETIEIDGRTATLRKPVWEHITRE